MKKAACTGLPEFSRITGASLATLHGRMKMTENKLKIVFQYGDRKYYDYNELVAWHKHWERRINSCTHCKKENPTLIKHRLKFCDNACAKNHFNFILNGKAGNEQKAI